MIPSVIISPRGEERLRSGHPWIYRADVVDARAAAGDSVVVRERARPDARPRALQRSIADRAAHADRTATSRPTMALIRRRIEAAIAFREHAGDRRDRLPPRPRRSRPAAVAHRRSLRRLPRRADAVAGHGPAAAAGRRRRCSELLQPRGILARNDPRTRLLEGLEQQVEVLAGRRAGDGRGHRERHRVRRRSAARPEDRPVPRSAREPAPPRRCTRAAGCSTASATTAGSRWRWRARCQETIAIDISEDAVARVQAERRAQRRRRSTRASATCSTSCAGSSGCGERFDTIVLDPPAFAKNKAAVDEGARRATRRSTCAR